MLILETSSTQITYELLEEAVNRKIPKHIHEQLSKMSVRKKMLEKFGRKAFLKPDKLKFPIVRPDSKDGEPCCKLLYAAYTRAKQWGYNDIADKAKKLFKDTDCNKRMDIQMEDISETPMDINTVLELLDEGLQQQNHIPISYYAKLVTSHI